jgi:hypothetical protein
LQELVGVFEEILEFVALSTESLGGELRGHLDSRHGRIFRNIANLVDLDAGFTGERGFQLFRERGGFRVAAWKTAYEAGKLRLRQIWRKVNAGNTGACEQLRKTFFTGGRTERHAVQQDLVPRRAKQKPATAALIERTSELFPRSLKLRRSPHVAKFIEACELQ